MTNATLSRRAAGHARDGYGFRTAARMEWRKLRTVRSTWYIAAAFAATMIGLAMVALSHEGYGQMSAADRASFDPTHDCFIGLVLGQLLVGTLGVLAITSEFSSGMIRATFAAVPRRGLLLAAKAAVLGAVTLAVGEITAFAAFLAGQAVLKAPAPHAALGQPGVLRAVLMAGAYPAPGPSSATTPDRPTIGRLLALMKHDSKVQVISSVAKATLVALANGAEQVQ
jgi:ABC-2 type transport system permease protein